MDLVKPDYGPKFGSFLSEVPKKYYYSGVVTDIKSESLIINSVTLDNIFKSEGVIFNDTTLLQVSLSSINYGTFCGIKSTISKTTGRWYWECKITGTLGYGLLGSCIGVGTDYTDYSSRLGSTDYGWSYCPLTGELLHNNISSPAPKAKEGDIIGIALDQYNHKLWFSLNGNWFSGNPSDGSYPSFYNIGDKVYPFFSLVSSYLKVPILDFIVDPTLFSYSAPSGYYFYGGSVRWEVQLFRVATSEIINYDLTNPLTNSYYLETPFYEEHLIICKDASRHSL